MAGISAVKQYNNLMFDIARDHLTIGTKASQKETEGWNLRDMVSEVQYTLDIYEDPSCIYWEDAHDESQPPHRPWYKEWINNKARMKRFIDKYKDEALKLECTENHSSKFD